MQQQHCIIDDKNLIVVCIIKRKLVSSSRLLAFCPTLAKEKNMIEVELKMGVIQDLDF